jgi:hypothetical protein
VVNTLPISYRRKRGIIGLNWQILIKRRKQVNKEYYQAKADLCRDLAIKQMVEGNAKEAGDNLIRMVNALNQINLINYKEEKGNE